MRSGAVTPNWIMLPTAWTSSTWIRALPGLGERHIKHDCCQKVSTVLSNILTLTLFSLSAAPPSAAHQPHAGELRPGKNRSWTSLGAEALSVSQPISKSLTLIMTTPFSSIILRACSFLLPSFTVRTWSSNTST